MPESPDWRHCATLIVALLPGPAVSDTLDLNLNDDAVRLTYLTTLAGERLELGGAWLHHQDNGDIAHVSLHRVGAASPGTRPVEAGLGGRVLFVDADRAGQDAIVLGIGGFVRARLPNYDRIGFAAHAYFAPDVLTFGDADDFVEVAGRVSYSVIREADVYAGLRYISAGFERGDVTFDTGLHIGINLRF